MNKTVLICDDQPIIHDTLGLYLKEAGYEVVSAYDGQESLKMFETHKPAMVILDLMMPILPGIDVCQAIRRQGNTPIIMLTAKGEELDRILGIELGADDYIVKPFSAREVVARVKAVLRRQSDAIEVSAPKLISIGGLEIDVTNYGVKVNGEKVALTPKEVEILEMLASKPGTVYTREHILSRVWGYDYYGDTRAVDTQIKRIRQKLPKEGLDFVINTIYGIGYKFETLS